ncbi:hypothetical protein E2C01_064613 [Portunus trituberculatus]|uniref:Uncharacterized protein n=1 Tax=Portunus trituberculatus TaxID=210409 RepID=A0A5B7HMC1_PORTR|nr:hypothetical protein [Portunus trituberculatus]
MEKKSLDRRQLRKLGGFWEVKQKVLIGFSLRKAKWRITCMASPHSGPASQPRKISGGLLEKYRTQGRTSPGGEIVRN